MFGEVLGLIRGTKIWTKEAWKTLTWKKGWILNDAINNIRLLSHREMDLFREVQDSIQYSVWWIIADYRPDLVYISETMVKLLSHASDLKTDNPLLKSGPRNLRVCTFCNTNSEDSAFHMILQCSDTEVDRDEMFQAVRLISNDERETLQENANIFATMMGRPIEGMSEEVMLYIWITIGQYIHKIYKRRIKTPEGIG